jgi:hypothetical protein
MPTVCVVAFVVVSVAESDMWPPKASKCASRPAGRRSYRETSLGCGVCGVEGFCFSQLLGGLGLHHT